MTTKTRGRPSLYREEYAEQACKLCLLGATDQELADFFEIDVRTIYDWKRTKPEFSQAIARGKMLADAEVAAKLYERGVRLHARRDKDLPSGRRLGDQGSVHGGVPAGHHGGQLVAAQSAAQALAG